MKLDLGAGRYPLDGFENLNEPGSEWTTDPLFAWRAEEGLAAYGDGSIEAVTVSHLFMYLEPAVIFDLLVEIRRVLMRPAYVSLMDNALRCGVLRITEDETWGPYTPRPGVQPGAVTATSGYLLEGLLHVAGFTVHNLAPDETRFHDRSLIQAWHGDPPAVFHLEAIKP